MKLYILEAYDSNMQFDDDVIVALTPEVCYHLDKRGIDYSIIEDHYNEHELFEDRHAFLQNQDDWFRGFDIFLKNNIDILNTYDLNLTNIYSYHIKNTVDTIIFKSYVLNALFNKFNPSSIVFITFQPNEKVLKDDLGYHDKSVYAHLIPIICEKDSINLLEHFGYSAQNIKNVTHNISDKISKVRKYIPSIYEMLRSVSRPKKQKHVLNILQLNIAYNGFEIIKDVFVKGHNAYLLTGNRIFKFHRFGFRIFDIKHNNAHIENAFHNWDQTAQLLETHELIKWINEKCSLDVSNIVLPNLKYFISNICPVLLQYYEIFLSFYETESIDVVLSPYMQSTIELAAIAAANKCEHTKTTCVEHGDDVFKNSFWRQKELINFNILIVSDEENKQYLESICEKYKFGTKIYSSSERMRPMIKLGEYGRAGKYGSLDNNNEIIYLPTFLNWDSLWIDANINISPTKYYKFQKSILDNFAQKDDYTFIWKGLFSSERLYNPISNLIKDAGIENVKTETGHFKKYLPYANKVICDYPSTGMYESIIAGVPTMCLCSDELSVRKSGIQLFENVIKFYHNVDEAIEHIDEFINTDPEQYAASLEICDNKLIDIIESECGI